MMDDRPAWAQRMTNEREARGWSQADAAWALRANAAESEKLPIDNASLLRRWKRWEDGEVMPGGSYRPIIARTFGTVTHAMFPVRSRRDPDRDALTGMDTLELVSRLQRADLDDASLNALRAVVDGLCSEYAYLPADQLLTEGRTWLRKITQARAERLTLKQQREILVLAGWVTLLIACVEYDIGNRRAETTRQAALSLGIEAAHPEIQGWAHEIRAWINLTSGDYHGAIAAARAGTEAAPLHGVAVQLAAQEAKAWARIGDRRRTEAALSRGRRLLEALPYPEQLRHHFVVDPAKFDFYAMDCYRHLAEDKLAQNLANEVIRSSTSVDGTVRAPMRTAEASVTLGVVAARQGDLEQAVEQGGRALTGQRTSLPSLVMVSRELVRVLKSRYLTEPATDAYLDQLRAVTGAARAYDADSDGAQPPS